MKNWNLKLLFILILQALPVSSYAHGQCPLYFESNRICADFTWIVPPAPRAHSIFLLRFWRDGQPLELTREPEVVLWMNMPCHNDTAPSDAGVPRDCGHGSIPVVIQRERAGLPRSAGAYLIERASFFMAGVWQVRIAIEPQTPGSVREQISHLITIP